VVDRDLMKILNYLIWKFGDEKQRLEQFLMNVDGDGNTFFNLYFSRPGVRKMISISREFFETIKIYFDLEFLKCFLLVKNDQHRNFHHTLLANKNGGGVKECLEILQILLEVIGKDREFFIDLTEQEEIQDEIREFLDENFFL
jgi:hypothetical protein